MKIDNVKIPKSSFLSVEKDFSIIIDKILSNQRLKKLLYYTDKDCLSKPNLSEEESELIYRLSSLSKMYSTYGCQPVLNIEPTNNSHTLKQYTFIKNISLNYRNIIKGDIFYE